MYALLLLLLKRVLYPAGIHASFYRFPLFLHVRCEPTLSIRNFGSFSFLLLAKVVSLSISPRYKTLVPTTSRRGDGCEGLDLVVGS